jgi:hypothetical protein
LSFFGVLTLNGVVTGHSGNRGDDGGPENTGRKEFLMRKANYKGRCEKRKVSKCEYICRTYSKIQSVYVDELEKDDTVASFECNVFLKGVADTLYTTDFVIKMTDGSIRVRECVWRFNLNKPSYD